MKKKPKLLLLLIILLLIALVVTTATLAVWMQKSTGSKYLEFSTKDDNASVKYQIYVPVNINGARIDGTMNIIERDYVLANEEDIEEVVGYALVGWDGGIALSRLEVPSTYTMKINGTDTTKLTVSIVVDKDFEDYNFSGNTVITEIEIAQSINKIQTGAFSFMSNLESLKLVGTTDIVIGDYAFGSCAKLTNINKGNRTIIGNESLIFFRS